MEIASEITFGDEKVKKAYLELESKKFQERQLKEWLDRAFKDLEKDAFSGIQIPKKLIPKEYELKFFAFKFKISLLNLFISKSDF